MKSVKIIAGLAIAGGLAAGALGVGAGVATADPGEAGAPVPTRWGPPSPPPPPYYGGGPIPGGWNGGWEPNGGFCLGPFCV